MRHALIFTLALLGVGCSTPYERQVSPFQQCQWTLSNGLEPFKNSSNTVDFVSDFNPNITVSRQGLTARVVGVLSDQTMARFNGSLSRVIAHYPHLTPVRFVAAHSVNSDNLNKSRVWRAANHAGEVVSTSVNFWPENTVMIIYPVSVAAPGYNTAAGNWSVIAKNSSRPNDKLGDFGNFPFLKYTWQGHALHGPITGDSETNLWSLRRGRVSHGCNRMEGEHIVELSVLLGCPANGAGSCSASNEKVTVMEDFDYFPDPKMMGHQVGLIDDYSIVFKQWITPDVEAFSRDSSAPLQEEYILDDAILIRNTFNKAWGENVLGITNIGLAAGTGVVEKRSFPSWNNMETERSNDDRQFVTGTNCKL